MEYDSWPMNNIGVITIFVIISSNSKKVDHFTVCWSHLLLLGGGGAEEEIPLLQAVCSQE